METHPATMLQKWDMLVLFAFKFSKSRNYSTETGLSLSTGTKPRVNSQTNDY